MKRQLAMMAGLAAILLAAGGATAVDIVTVPVGNPGNLADTRYETPGYGAVGYEYNIGKYEVTTGQYTEFLNAVAAEDTYGLYNTGMWSEDHGCKIQRSGSSGSYIYNVAGEWANRPVNYVSFWDASRFANWLHNGQPDGAQGPGTTERGVYTLDGYNGNDGRTIQRNADWKWAIPTEEEWYKAAYHKNDNDTGNYFDYPTSSDGVPGRDISEATNTSNNANYDSGNNDYVIGSPYYRTEVGEFELSESPYGTFDQGGNIYEWNETIVDEGLDWTYRGIRGGSFDGDETRLHASYRYSGSGGGPTHEDDKFGFRVSEVPEPATLSLLAIGGLALIRRKKQA